MAWIQKNTIPDRFEYLTCQSDERKQRFPSMSDETCLKAIQLVLPRQKILSGADAIPEILSRLRGWSILQNLFQIPGVRWLAPIVYRWIANNRYRISCMIKS